MKGEVMKGGRNIHTPNVLRELEQRIFHRDINISTYTVLCVAPR